VKPGRLSVVLFATDRRCLLLLVAAWMLLATPGLGRRDLWDPDEPRTAQVTLGLLQGPSMAVPEANGQPWLEKPPLYYWLAAMASKARGRVDEIAVRLPANAAALALVLALFAFGRTLFGRRAGALAGLALLTTEDFLIEARWARPDVLLALFLTVAAWCLWEALREEARWPWGAGFFLASGFAVLTKGPVGLLLVPSAIVVLAATRRLRRILRWQVGAGLCLMMLPVALWMSFWSARTGVPFPLAAVLDRFRERIVTGVHHARPSWQVLLTLPLSLVPWIAVVPAALRETFPLRGAGSAGRDERMVFLYSILLTDLLLFAASTEKRGIYLLPMVPLLFLLVGRFWDTSLLDWDPAPSFRWVRAGLWTWVAAVAVAAGVVLPRLRREAPPLFAAAAWLAAAGLVAALVSALVLWHRGSGASLSCFALGSAVCGLFIVALVFPALDPFKSARVLGARAAAVAGRDPICILHDPHPGLSWYAGRPLVLEGDAEALAGFMRSSSHGVCLAEAEQWDAIPEARRPAARVVESAFVGHRRFVLLEAR
jgi:4-amino-4-deoxy-L-arabinose transferase-like glycosyltransferase